MPSLIITGLFQIVVGLYEGGPAQALVLVDEGPQSCGGDFS
jgi:hypothetical protein